MEITVEAGTPDRLLPWAKMVLNGAAESAKTLSALKLGCAPGHASVPRCSPWRTWASVDL